MSDTSMDGNERPVCNDCGIWIATRESKNGVFVGCACTSATLSKWNIRSDMERRSNSDE